MGLFVDGASVPAALTPNPYDPGHAAFDMIKFKNGGSLKGREFKLDWKVSRDKAGEAQWAQVSFLIINFVEGN